MADLVDGEPEGGQRAQPEDEERGVVSGGGARVGGEGVMDSRAVLGVVLEHFRVWCYLFP